MLTTHAVGSATAPPIVYCSFVFRVVDFIIDDLKKKKKTELMKTKNRKTKEGGSRHNYNNSNY